MSRHSTEVSLRQMLEHAQEAMELARGRVRSDLDSDRVISLAVTRLLEIVGEAAARVPEEDRERAGDIPWMHVVGLRNRLIHGYDMIDHDIVWQVLTADLPALVEALKRHLQDRERARPEEEPG